MQVPTSITEAKLKTIFSSKVQWREVLALLMLLLAIVFFRSERKELYAIVPNIKQANHLWVVTALGVSLLYVFLQAVSTKKALRLLDVSFNVAMQFCCSPNAILSVFFYPPVV